MNKIENILIIGLGAIGSIYATKFQDYDSACVNVLLDESRFDRYQKDGISFNGEKYDFNYVLPSNTNLKTDLIIIATKSNDFLKAAEMIETFVKEDTVILSLLNGISSEPILIDKFGKEKVLYSYFIGHTSMKQGLNITHDGVGTVVFGEEDNTNLSKNVLRVKELFDRVNIDYKIPEDMLSSMWQKFIINIGINQSSAILRANYKMFHESEEVKELARDLMDESVNLAKKIGIKDTDDFIANAFKLIENIPPEAKSSMLQDVENNRKTEIDVFAGEIIRLGKIYNVPTPKNEFAYKRIKEIELVCV